MEKISINLLITKISKKLNTRYKDNTLCQQYAWWMLEKIFNKTKTDLITEQLINNEIALTPEHEKTINYWIDKQVIDKEPIQYLLGSVPFCDLEILVEPPILIPRPETEELCYFIIDKIRLDKNLNPENLNIKNINQKILHPESINTKILNIESSNPESINNKILKILDIGTGSGCIALSLAKAFEKSHVYACDISDKALELAKKNASHNKIENIKLIKSDIYSDIQKKIDPNIKFDLIISNPPYISQDEFLELDESVKNWEDKGALVAKNNGLEIIDKIISNAPQFLNNNGILAIEIGYKQGQAVKDIFIENGFLDVNIQKDLQEKDRFVIGKCATTIGNFKKQLK